MLPPRSLTARTNDIITDFKKMAERLKALHQIDRATASRLVFLELTHRLAHQLNQKLNFQDEKLEQLRTKSMIKLDDSHTKSVLENPELFDILYENTIDETYRKKKGQFLTPPQVAEFMAKWGILEKCHLILDPAVGTGILLEKVSRTLRTIEFELYGVDIDPILLNAAWLRLLLSGVRPGQLTLVQGDFLKMHFLDVKFDLVICNPPYLNFHDYDRHLDIKSIERKFGLKLSRLTNIYSLFFMQGYSYVKENGKLVFITPSEFFYTGYGEQLKRFLLKHFTIEAFVLIDFSRTVFSDALTTAVITLLRKTTPSWDHKVKFVRVLEWPEDPNVLIDAVIKGIKDDRYLKLYEVPQTRLDPTDKWLVHFEGNDYASVIQKLVPLVELAEVNRGIATGHNDYFTLTQREINTWKIEDRFLRPVISKATDIAGYDFTLHDYEELKRKGKKVFLLYVFEEPSANLRRYIHYGEKLGVNKRYLTQHRQPWYSMEKGKVAPILATVFHRAKMRFIFNKTNCLNLTAFHGIYPRFESEIMTKALLAYLNSNLCRGIQIIKRREYGGGLHKFEPKDLEKLPVLDVTRLDATVLKRLADLFENLCNAVRVSIAEEEKVKDEIDTELAKILGLTETIVRQITKGHPKLDS